MDKTDAEIIRETLEKHYAEDLKEKISRVEFVLPTGERPYFHIADSFKHTAPPPPPQHRYVLEIYDSEDVRELEFRSIKSLLTSFACFQRLNQYQLIAKEDGKIIQEFIPQ